MQVFRQAINTDKAPQAIGAYSQAVKADKIVFLSGQIPLVPDTMEILPGDFAEQTVQVIENLKAVAEAAGGTLDHIIKLNVFLTDLNNFSIVNEVIARYFSEPYPARAVVEVSALPKNVEVEIEAIMQLN